MQNPLEKHCCKALLQLITSLDVTHWSPQAYTSFHKAPQAAQAPGCIPESQPNASQRTGIAKHHQSTELQKALAAQDPSNEAQGSNWGH